MFRFENPLDLSKDGINPFIDGIRYHIRDSESIKEKIEKYIKLYRHEMKDMVNIYDSPIDTLERLVNRMGYELDDLTINDEHELLSLLIEVINEG